MPSEHTIPSRRERLCEPCEFHKMVNAMFGGPGNVWRDYNCMHPEAFDDLNDGPMADPEKEKLRQRIIGRMLADGRSIGKTERQPDWCPLRRDNAQAQAS